MKAIRLRTEHMENPLGIDIREPYLSWNCSGGERQSAYEVEALSGGQTIWNSGKVASGKMNAAFGAAVQSRQRVSWRVRLWDEEDTAGDWSEDAFFEMGLLDKEEFVAKWINPELAPDPAVHKPASYLRTSFPLEKTGAQGSMSPATACTRLISTGSGYLILCLLRGLILMIRGLPVRLMM